MIIVVEGASAAGKTAWCRRFAGGRALFEGEPRAGPAPPGASDPSPADPAEAARYWTRVNAERWQAARAMSERLGFAICDTDPFKLHWAWTLWVNGLAPASYWEACRDSCRRAFADKHLGFADLVLFADVEPETLRRQKAGDATRKRSRHEMHVSIAPALKRWYRAISVLEPARVEFQLPASGLDKRHLRLGPRPERSGAPLFDQLMAELERQSA